MNWHTTLFEKMQNIKKWTNWKTLQALYQERGAIFVLTAILLPLMFGFIGISYDVGNLYMHKARLQNVADAAALAGAREYVNQKETPDSHGKTDIEANKFINSNLVNLNNADSVTPDEKSHLVRQSVDGSKTKTYYRIGLTENVGLSFLPVLGINRNATVQASAVALAEGTASNTLPSVPVPASASFSIFDNLFTFSEYLFLDNINENGHADASFDGRIVYTMLNNNTETSSNPNDFFYKLGDQPGMSVDKRHIYNQKGNVSNGQNTSHINDPYLNPYFNTRDYVETFKQWLRTDEAGKKLYYEVTSDSYQEFNTSFINQHLDYNVFHYNYDKANGNMVVNVSGNISTSKYNDDTPVYVIVEPQVHLLRVHLNNNSRPIVVVYLGNERISIESGDKGKLVLYAPDSEVYLVNFNGTYTGNIIAKRIALGGGHSQGSWFVKNFLENGSDYIDPYIKARREQIEANIMANAAAANSEANYQGIINALQDYLNNGNSFKKHANEVLALLGYADDKAGSGYDGGTNNEVTSWYARLTEAQKRSIAEALRDYLYGNSTGSPASGGGSDGGTSQSVDASSVKIRLISDSELKDTPFASL